MANHRLRLHRGALGQLLLDLQAGGAGAALLRDHRAEGVFVPLAVVRQLPGLHRTQRHRQTRRFAERSCVVLVHFGTGEDFREIFVGIHWSFVVSVLSQNLFQCRQITEGEGRQQLGRRLIQCGEIGSRQVRDSLTSPRRFREIPNKTDVRAAAVRRTPRPANERLAAWASLQGQEKFEALAAWTTTSVCREARFSAPETGRKRRPRSHCRRSKTGEKQRGIGDYVDLRGFRIHL